MSEKHVTDKNKDKTKNARKVTDKKIILFLISILIFYQSALQNSHGHNGLICHIQMISLRLIHWDIFLRVNCFAVSVPQQLEMDVTCKGIR